MTVRYTTSVPNMLFDHHLGELSVSELKVLLVVIRQTWGWTDKFTGKKKQWDWISGSQFRKKTGLSQKSISKAIDTLISKRMIIACDSTGFALTEAHDRRSAKRIFYSLGKGLFEQLPVIR